MRSHALACADARSPATPRSATLEALLPRVRVPFLAVHGTADRVVDVASSRRLVAAAASEDKTLVEVPGALHSLLCELPPVRAAVLARVTDWLAPRAAAAGAAAAAARTAAPAASA
jgi:alpha-beta hydrolase superfamily lysophospholipase